MSLYKKTRSRFTKYFKSTQKFLIINLLAICIANCSKLDIKSSMISEDNLQENEEKQEDIPKSISLYPKDIYSKNFDDKNILLGFTGLGHDKEDDFNTLKYRLKNEKIEVINFFKFFENNYRPHSVESSIEARAYFIKKELAIFHGYNENSTINYIAHSQSGNTILMETLYNFHNLKNLTFIACPLLGCKFLDYIGLINIFRGYSYFNKILNSIGVYVSSDITKYDGLDDLKQSNYIKDGSLVDKGKKIQENIDFLLGKNKQIFLFAATKDILVNQESALATKIEIGKENKSLFSRTLIQCDHMSILRNENIIEHAKNSFL